MADKRLVPQAFSDESHGKARTALLKLINARYSVPTWLWASSSLISTLIIIMLTFTDAKSAAPFVNAVFLGQFWAPLAAIASAVAMVSMALKKFKAVRYAAFASFCLWVFGAIAFAGSGAGIIIFYFVGQIILFWGYKYLASFVRVEDRL